MPRLTVNGKQREFEAEPDMPLVRAPREQLGLAGPKHGCGIAECGTCKPDVEAGGVINLSRRRFLGGAAVVSGSLIVGFSVPFAADAQAQADRVREVNAWVVVNPDDSVVIRIARSEMGQGTLTGLAQLVAEELDCNWAKVRTEYPTPGQNRARKRIWGSFSTGGSSGIRASNDYVRKGGAAARMMLVQAAANDWKVPVAECVATAGVITHPRSGRTTTYGKVAPAAAKLTPPGNVPLKDPKDWTIAGRRLARLDTVAKTTGRQAYGIDLKLPGMLNASLRTCPVFGGKVKGYNETAALKRPGVRKVVPIEDFAVAIVADTWWHAESAFEALALQWDLGPNAQASSARFTEVMKAGLDAADAAVGNAVGDVRVALASAARRIEAVYSFPHQHPVTMEPMNATAKWTRTRCEVWVPTQNGEASLSVAAEAAGLPIEQCEIYKQVLGGGFGRRVLQDYTRYAVLVAKALPGTPVKLLWSREVDMTHGRYHPVTMCKLTAGLDNDGNLAALHLRISGQSILAGTSPQSVRDGKDPDMFQGLNPPGAEGTFGYTVPNLLIDCAMRNPHVPPGYWRAVNFNQNAFYVECFIDEIAHATGQDPLLLRRKLMAKHPKHLAVLNAVAERAGWGSPLPKGVYRGIAQGMDFGSYVASVAEVSVSDAGKLRIHRIVAAIDPGHVVNPQQVEAQVEGSFAFGLSAALWGAITVKDGRVEQQNFDDYPIMTMAAIPTVEVVIAPSGGFWGGVGEPTTAVAAPAVLNAVFAATGKRVRELPLANHGLKTA